MNASNSFLRGAVSEDQRFFIINWEVPKRLLGGGGKLGRNVVDHVMLSRSFNGSVLDGQELLERV